MPKQEDFPTPHDPEVQEPAFPRTPVGRVMAAYLDALNAGDRALLRRFLAEHSVAEQSAGAVDDQVRQELRLYHRTRGLDACRIEHAEEDELIVVARARHTAALPWQFSPDGLYRLTLRVSPEPPYPILSTDVRPVLHTPVAFVDVGGRRLAYRDLGTGSPTVVLDAGGGCAGETWDWVVFAVAQHTRVICHDRADFGASDATARGWQTDEEIVTDLHTLLTRRAIPGPYVLVGHSLGGLYAQLYTHHHPAAVAGVVLVGPARGGHRGDS